MRAFGRPVATLARLFAAVCLAVVTSPAAAGAQAPRDQKVASPKVAIPEVALPGTQLLQLHSAIAAQDYVLHVNLPRGYDEAGTTYPVIYSVDGQWDFTLVQAIYGQQYYDGFMPAAILVGITWGGAQVDYDRRRAFDLTPTPSGQPDRFGNAEKFLAFIEKEAIPFVESRYRTTKDERTLTGSSFGGLFTLYALFQRSGLFNRYVLTSPSWNWDNGALSTYGEKFAKAKLARPVKVFMGIGEYEDAAGLEKLAATMRGYQVAGLEVQTKVVAGAGHAGAKAEGFTRGLQYVFDRPCKSVAPETLARYAGEYAVNPMAKVKFAPEAGRLVVYPPGGPKTVLCAAGDNEFRLLGSFFDLRFVESPDGRVGGFELRQYNGKTVGKRVGQ